MIEGISSILLGHRTVLTHGDLQAKIIIGKQGWDDLMTGYLMMQASTVLCINDFCIKITYSKPGKSGIY